MEFAFIRRYNRQRQASGSDLTRAAKQEDDLLTQTLHGYAEYTRRTPRFLSRVWRSL